jgi:uncharacterized protein (DUF58 family)
MNRSDPLFKKIRQIQILTTHLSQNLFAGAYRSAFKGRGVEFEEVREYQPGDDVRCIDWNVMARMNRPYIKNFREERDISMMLVVDISASLQFGSSGQTKAELVAEIAAILAFSAIKNQDRVGLLLFSDRIEQYLPPRKGVRHVLRVIRELLAFKPQGKGSELGEALDFLGRVLPRSGICFVLSDFICDNYGHQAALAAKRHDFVAIGLSDPYERHFPDLGLITLTDLESHATRLIDTANLDRQRHFASAVQERVRKTKALMGKIGASFIAIETGKSYLPALQQFFKMRGRRR